MQNINDLKVNFPIIDTYLQLLNQSSKYQFQGIDYRGQKITIPVYVGGRGKNPTNWDAIQDAAKQITQLVKNEIDRQLSQATVDASENKAKKVKAQKLKLHFTLFALITIGGFASVCNIGNVLHLVGDGADIATKIACFGFGLYLSFCFAYFAILSEHSKASLTAWLLGFDVVSHFMVMVGVVSFENKWIAFVYAIYYAAQLVISMIAISNLAKNKNFMVSMFGSETA
jgi:hypothetical protein